MNKTYLHITFLLVALMTCLTASAQSVNLKTYYAAAVGKKKADLKAALHDIIGKASVLEYGSGSNKTWYGFYQTDRMSNNEVRDRYSNDHRYFSTSSPYNSVSGMNIEHSLANSWWGGTKNQAYKDIHHLMPCEAKINSSKSNYGMGKVTSVKTNNGCTKVGTGPGASGNDISMWEPADKWKGDFARVYFYMVTCYSNLTWKAEALKSIANNDYPTLLPWAYQLYLQWSQNDPVDDIERTRNEAVYAIQGNRNPFIDFPDLAEYIWGSKTDVAFTIDGTLPPDPTPTPEPGETVTLLEQDFLSDIGSFMTVNVDGTQTQVWSQNKTYGAVANAFNLGKTGDAWLITPAIDLTDMQEATLEFNHATGYNTSADASTMFEVLISPDYAQRPADAEWESLVVSWPERPSSGFTKFVHSGSIPLDDYVGETVNIAFRYRADASACWAWEIKNVVLKGKTLPTGIDQNYMSPVEAEDAVFDMNGRYVGSTIPAQRGIYIVRRGGYTYKRFVK